MRLSTALEDIMPLDCRSSIRISLPAPTYRDEGVLSSLLPRSLGVPCRRKFIVVIFLMLFMSINRLLLKFIYFKVK